MSVRTEHTCDLCGERSSWGVHIEARTYNDQYPNATPVIYWDRDLCRACFERADQVVSRPEDRAR